MSWFEDAANTFVNTAKNSGVPGVSQVAGIGAGLTGIGRDPAAPGMPQYNPYDYNKAAYEVSPEFQGETNALRENYNLQRMAPNPGQANAGMYADALSAQRDAMLGRGPSVAQQQLQMGMAANNAQAASAAGMARGSGNMALAQMNANHQIAANNSALNDQMGLLRAKEMENARAGMFGAISSDRAANVAGYNAQQGAILNNAQALANREGMRMSNAQRLDENRAGQAAMAQGRQFQSWQADRSGEAQDRDNEARAQNNMISTVMQGISRR